jgi:hypothetical protein
MTRAKHALSLAEGAQSAPSSENVENILNFAPLRLGGINLPAVILSNILDLGL